MITLVNGNPWQFTPKAQMDKERDQTSTRLSVSIPGCPFSLSLGGDIRMLETSLIPESEKVK